MVAIQVSLRRQGAADLARRLPRRSAGRRARKARGGAPASRRRHRSWRATQGRQGGLGREHREHLRGHRAGVVRTVLDEMGQRSCGQDHPPARAQRVPLAGFATDQGDHGAGASRGSATGRVPGRERDGAPGTAGMRAGVPICDRHRPRRARSVAGLEWCVGADPREAFRLDHRTPGGGRVAARHRRVQRRVRHALRACVWHPWYSSDPASFARRNGRSSISTNRSGGFRRAA